MVPDDDGTTIVHLLHQTCMGGDGHCIPGSVASSNTYLHIPKSGRDTYVRIRRHFLIEATHAVPSELGLHCYWRSSTGLAAGSARIRRRARSSQRATPCNEFC